jgi:hypothetical protein
MAPAMKLFCGRTLAAGVLYGLGMGVKAKYPWEEVLTVSLVLKWSAEI